MLQSIIDFRVLPAGALLFDGGGLVLDLFCEPQSYGLCLAGSGARRADPVERRFVLTTLTLITGHNYRVWRYSLSKFGPLPAGHFHIAIDGLWRSGAEPKLRVLISENAHRSVRQCC